MDSSTPEDTAATPTAGPMRALATWMDTGEPRAHRGPFTRWPRTTDAIIVLAVFAISVVSVTLSALPDGTDFTLESIEELSTGRVVLLGLLAISLWWRRSHALEVTALLLAVTVLWALASYGDGQDLALFVGIYSVGRYCKDNRRSLAVLTAALTISILGFLIDPNQRVDIAPAVILTVLPWYAGLRIRNRGDYLALLTERARSLEAEQLARAREAVAEERSRIARELHDVVAHQVSMMTVQAGAAKTVATTDMDAAIEAMVDVEGAGRKALGELRHLLGVLRPDTADADELAPQPGLGDLESLVDELTRTGADVELSVTDLPDDIPRAVDLSAYRIAQESITNIIKHAGPNPTVVITVAGASGRMLIDITNTTAEKLSDNGADRLPGSGFGIAGMRERATLLGGTLSAEPEGPTGFRVQATLPLHLEPK